MKYYVKKVIAHTDEAKVLLAVCTKGFNSTTVIIKTVLPDIEGPIREKLVIAKLLSHANIQSLIDYGEYNNNNERFFYTCNLHVHGVYLTELLQSFAQQSIRPPLPLVYHIIGSICDALDYTHNFQFKESEAEFIPHGNICPDNILISFTGDVFLVNTGIADIVKYRFNGKQLIKNEHTVFSHPEICNGKPWQKRHEFYSIGMLLFCLLAGFDNFILFWDRIGKINSGTEKVLLPQISQPMHSLLSSLTSDSKVLSFSSMREIKEQIKKGFPAYYGNEKELSALITRAIFNNSEKKESTRLQIISGAVPAEHKTDTLTKNAAWQKILKTHAQQYEIETEPVS